MGEHTSLFCQTVREEKKKGFLAPEDTKSMLVVSTWKDKNKVIQ